MKILPNILVFLLFKLLFLTILLADSKEVPPPLSSALIKKQEKFGEIQGIPAAFGDLNLDKRTDIVVIVNDGIDIYFQKEDEANFYSNGRCKCDNIVQVYSNIPELHNDKKLNVLVLIQDERNGKQVYLLKRLVFTDSFLASKFHSKGYSSIATASAYSFNPNPSNSLISANKSANDNAINTNSVAPMPLTSDKTVDCDPQDLGIVLTSQPLLFDVDGDLLTDIMGLDENGQVKVWNMTGHETHADPTRWDHIKSKYFGKLHSNSFIDISGDLAADIVLSSNGHIMYANSNEDPQTTFKRDTLEFHPLNKRDTDKYGQSSLVDIDADGKIEHLLPVCSEKHCRIDLLSKRDKHTAQVQTTIFNFTQIVGCNYTLEEIKFANKFTFPIILRPADLNGDGYVDFLTVARNQTSNNTIILYLKNIERPSDDSNGSLLMKRTFQIVPIEHQVRKNHEIKIVAPFDIDENGKMDLLIGSSLSSESPDDMEISARMNTQIDDACFMKVVVTNGRGEQENRWGKTPGGISAIGPFVCFELDQNEMRGCAGQLPQSSHFALSLPYTIFGLGQTAHFVEKLTVTIPGFTKPGQVRTGTFPTQIVPDAQVIIIPTYLDNPNDWQYKLFLSPMSRPALSTLAALAVICLVLLVLIAFLHRKELKEDAAEHEEYRRHWPESR